MTSSLAQRLLEASLANSQQAIAQLPTEVLLSIFQHCSDWDPDKDDLSSFLTWTSVLHTVCTESSEDCLSTILRRSQELPLSIYIVSNPSLSDASLSAARVLLGQAHRTRYLSIKMESSAIPEMMEITRSTRGLPLLERLDLRIFPGRDDYLINLSELFPFPLPQLQRLDVMTCCSISRLLDAPNLERLSLQSTYLSCEPHDSDGLDEVDDLDVTIDLVELLDTLQKMPRLAVIQVSRVLPDTSGHIDTNTIKPISLSNIYSLVLQGPAYACTWLCDLLSVPATAGVALDLYVNDDSDVEMAVRCVARLFSRTITNPRELRSVALSSTPYGLVIEGASSTADIIEPRYPSFRSTLSDFWLHCGHQDPSHSEETYLEGLGAMLEVLPLSNMRALNVVGHKARANLVPRSLREAFLEGSATEAGPMVRHLSQPDGSSGPTNLTNGSKEVWQQMFPSLQVVSWDPRSSRNARA